MEYTAPEVVKILTEQPMVAIILADMPVEEYAPLMEEVRSYLVAYAKKTRREVYQLHKFGKVTK